MNWKNAIKFSLLLSLFWTLISVFGILGVGSSETGIELMKMLPRIVIQFITISILNFALFSIQFFTFNQKWKLNKKLWVSTVCSCLTVILCILVIRIIIYLFNVHPVEHTETMPKVFFILFIPGFVISVITVLITFIFYIVREREKNIVEIQNLSVENMQARFEALKNQLDPHFLFNSLNTLDGLMDFDIGKAHEYLQNLSSTFRYIIQNKEITTLKNEMQFAESYAFLMKIRYGEKLSIQYNIDKKYNDYFIMPMTLQLLIENAIKHNVINSDEPLTIHIETTENNTVKVNNAIQPKITSESGKGIGLANLIERYKLLFDKEVIITQNGIFTVEIPLIEQINDNSKIKI